MEKKIKSISNPKLSLNILDSDEVQQIHTATLDVIESTGVKFPSKKALDKIISGRRIPGLRVSKRTGEV